MRKLLKKFWQWIVNPYGDLVAASPMAERGGSYTYTVLVVPAINSTWSAKTSNPFEAEPYLAKPVRVLNVRGNYVKWQLPSGATDSGTLATFNEVFMPIERARKLFLDDPS